MSDIRQIALVHAKCKKLSRTGIDNRAFREMYAYAQELENKLTTMTAELDAVQQVANIAGVTVEVLAKQQSELLKYKARLQWMLSQVNEHCGWELTKKLAFDRAYDTVISIRNIEDIDEQMKYEQ
jgi:hypothetical protein